MPDSPAVSIAVVSIAVVIIAVPVVSIAEASIVVVSIAVVNIAAVSIADPHCVMRLQSSRSRINMMRLRSTGKNSSVYCVGKSCKEKVELKKNFFLIIRR
jgi:hypothetical protein